MFGRQRLSQQLSRHSPYKLNRVESDEVKVPSELSADEWGEVQRYG